MSVAVLISTLIETSAQDTQIETCEVVLSKLRKCQIEKTLPKRMLKRSIKIMEKKLSEL